MPTNVAAVSPSQGCPAIDAGWRLVTKNVVTGAGNEASVDSHSVRRGVAGTMIALLSLVVFRDTWGFLWWLGALALIGRSRNQLLLATCFVYTILLEWAGTANGNWLWAADVPFVGLHSANPPAGVGILYILLDLITVSLTSLRWQWLAPTAVRSDDVG
jgi:hypothetical protein